MLQGDRRQLVASKNNLVITYTAQKMRYAGHLNKVPDYDSLNLPVKIFCTERTGMIEVRPA